LFYVGLIVQPFLIAVYSTLFAIPFALSILVKILLEYSILKKGKQMLFKSHSLKWFIPAELLQVPYIAFAGLAGAFGNFQWKGRKVKR
jgi:hypothetical protein